MLDNEESRRSILIAALVFTILVTGVRLRSRIVEAGRLTDAGEQQRIVIEGIQNQIDELQHSVSRVRHATGSLSSMTPHQQTASRYVPPETLVQACATLLSAFQTHDAKCVGTQKMETPAGKTTIAAPRYRVQVEGDFQSVLRSMESIHTTLPDSCVVSCSMEASGFGRPCKWDIVFEFAGSRK